MLRCSSCLRITFLSFVWATAWSLVSVHDSISWNDSATICVYTSLFSCDGLGSWIGPGFWPSPTAAMIVYTARTARLGHFLLGVHSRVQLGHCQRSVFKTMTVSWKWLRQTRLLPISWRPALPELRIAEQSLAYWVEKRISLWTYRCLITRGAEHLFMLAFVIPLLQNDCLYPFCVHFYWVLFFLLIRSSVFYILDPKPLSVHGGSDLLPAYGFFISLQHLVMDSCRSLLYSWT